MKTTNRSKNFTSHFAAKILGLVLVIVALSGGQLKAQDLNTQMNQAMQAWKEMKYDKCQALFERITTVYGGRAPMLYGPKFGTIYYRKGLTELKLAGAAKRANNIEESAKWYEKAVKSFETCYKKFPNGAPGMAPSTNAQHKASIQRWAEASMGMKEYKQAIKLYEKFLEERDKNKDELLPTPGGFYINLAICHFLMEKPKIPEGISHFETALQNKDKMKTSDAGVVAAFLALSQAVIADKNEQAMVDFLGKNRSHITLAPYQMYEFNPVFLKLAANALGAEMYVAAFNLYAMIPDTEETIQDIKVRIEQLADRKGIVDGLNTIQLERLQKGLTKLKEEVTTGDPIDVKVLTAMWYLHNQASNQRGVYGALEQLELYYPKCSKREDNLFNLVRVSSLIGEILQTEHYGSVFLKAFPTSKKVEDVRRMMLSSLFFGGEYKKSLEVAEVLIEKVTKGTTQHDICLFVLGGSHFYLGNFDDAQPFLDEHVKTFPESKFIMHSEYFQGSNLTRLQYWEKAAKLLDAFLAKYPSAGKNIYLPNALYDRANCHFSESEYDPALVMLNRIENEFPQTAVVDMAYNMKGNIFESTAKYDDAEEYYILALNTAEKRANKIVAGESLSYLVGMLGAEKRDKKPNPRIKDAIPYYDKFFKEYRVNPYKPQIVVHGMPAMRAVGREQEGLDNLQAMIVEISRKKNQAFLEECVHAFSSAFLEVKGNTPDKLKDFYYTFPGIDASDKRTRALLRIAIIGVYEEQISKAIAEKRPDDVQRLEAGIKVLFRDLKNEFQPADLTNFVLIRIGDYLREKTSAPKQALPYYQELLKRENKEGYEFKARLGIADVMGSSDSSADNKQAIVELKRVHEASKDDPAIQEKALFRIVEISAKIEDWPAVEKNGRQYLKEKHTKKAAQVSFLFAKSFDERGETNDALFHYSMIYSRYPGFVSISAPATRRVMELLWKRDLSKGDTVTNGDKKIKLKEDDRQRAYSGIGARYVRITKKIRDGNKITAEEIAAWDAVNELVKEYETSGDVKTLEELKEEAEAERRGR